MIIFTVYIISLHIIANMSEDEKAKQDVIDAVFL